MRKLLSAAFAVAAFVLFDTPTANAYTTPTTISTISSRFAMRPVTARCLTPVETATDPLILFGAEAYVFVNPLTGGPEDYAVYRFEICDTLLRWLDGQTVSAKELGWAVLVVTHESYHLRGDPVWMNEAITNCRAVRHVRYAALFFGATEQQSYTIRNWAVWWYKRMPPSYQKRGCVLP